MLPIIDYDNDLTPVLQAKFERFSHAEIKDNLKKIKDINKRKRVRDHLVLVFLLQKKQSKNKQPDRFQGKKNRPQRKKGR